MGFLAWIIFGLITGVIAKFLMPGADPRGWIVTIALGIVGAVVGGWIGTQLGLGTVNGFTIHSFLLAVGGAILCLLVLRLVQRRTY